MEQGRSKQVRKSTGVADYKLARKKAGVIYRKSLGKAEAGLRLSSTSFRKITEGYLAERNQAVIDGEARKQPVKEETAQIGRYFVGFFGDAPIEDISQAAIDNYLKWRTVYWRSGPGKKDDSYRYERNGQEVLAKRFKTKPSLATLLKEINILRKVFNYAVRAGVLKEHQKLVIKPPRGQVGRRPSFEDHEVDRLLVHLYERATEEGISLNDRDARLQLWAFAVIAISTGMRPSEVLTLNWNNITGYVDEKDVPLNAVEELAPETFELRFNILEGKRQRPRRIVPLRSMTPTILDLWRVNFKQEGDKPVFIDDYGTQVSGYGKAIARALDTLGIRKSPTGQNRTQYSFRHYYITRMIRAGKSPAFVAHNVGTSIMMIERFYLHGDVEQYAHELGEF